MAFAPNFFDGGGGGDATLANQTAILAAIAAVQAKTNLIGTGIATTSAPVASSGVLGPLVSGDDYKTANNRALVWTVATATNPASCSIGIRKNDGVSLLVSGTPTHADGIATLTFELEDTQTALFIGRCRYSVEYIDGAGNEVTIQEGPVDFIKKYTVA